MSDPVCVAKRWRRVLRCEELEDRSCPSSLTTSVLPPGLSLTLSPTPNSLTLQGESTGPQPPATVITLDSFAIDEQGAGAPNSSTTGAGAGAGSPGGGTLDVTVPASVAIQAVAYDSAVLTERDTGGRPIAEWAFANPAISALNFTSVQGVDREEITLSFANARETVSGRGFDPVPSSPPTGMVLVMSAATSVLPVGETLNPADLLTGAVVPIDSFSVQPSSPTNPGAGARAGKAIDNPFIVKKPGEGAATVTEVAMPMNAASAGLLQDIAVPGAIRSFSVIQFGPFGNPSIVWAFSNILIQGEHMASTTPTGVPTETISFEGEVLERYLPQGTSLHGPLLPPTSRVNALAAVEPSASFTLSWTGADPNGFAIASYDVYYSDNGGLPTLLLQDTTQTSTTFTGQIGHTYAFYSLATDEFGLTGTVPSKAQATTQVMVGLEPDPLVTGKTALAVYAPPGGSSAIVIRPTGVGGGVGVTVNGAVIGAYQPTGHILAFGQGAASVTLAQASLKSSAVSLTVPAIIFGGAGTNNLDASGSKANNVLVGGASPSTLVGGHGHDILIGGTASTLTPGPGNDLLVFGAPPFESDLHALINLMAEWQRTDESNQIKVAHLIHGGGNNGKTVLAQAQIEQVSAIGATLQIP